MCIENVFDKLKAIIAKKRPELANWWSIVFHHDNAKLCCINCKEKTVTVWLKHSTVSSVFARFCSVQLLLIPVIKKFFSS